MIHGSQVLAYVMAGGTGSRLHPIGSANQRILAYRQVDSGRRGVICVFPAHGQSLGVVARVYRSTMTRCGVLDQAIGARITYLVTTANEGVT